MRGGGGTMVEAGTSVPKPERRSSVAASFGPRLDPVVRGGGTNVSAVKRDIGP